MLILLPSSEAKRPVPAGPGVEYDALPFPSLTPLRTQLLHEADGGDGAAAPAGEIYAGPMYQALGYPGLSAAERRRADRWIVIISSLWGAVRPHDDIASYRLSMCARPTGIGHLPQAWGPLLDDVLPYEVGPGLIVDGRSAEFVTAWRPSGRLNERLVTLRIVRHNDRSRGSAAHPSKWTRGLVARQIVVDGLDAATPSELAESLSQHFDVHLHPAKPASRGWVLDVVESK